MGWRGLSQEVLIKVYEVVRLMTKLRTQTIVQEPDVYAREFLNRPF